ncbi:hypothetical protein [Streptomyces sp. NPDC020571]|uniref:hypothetical protein n=1 Tax=Streptomyces sp. NPDC020571 TaxID=3365079 RepID=UPI0037B364B0
MTNHYESTGPDPPLSSDFVRRVKQYQTAAVNARLHVFLQAQGVPASEVDDLVTALEVGGGRRGAVPGGEAGRQGAGLSGLAVRRRVG